MSEKVENMRLTLVLTCLILLMSSVQIALAPKSGAAVLQAVQQETADEIRIFGLVNRPLNLTLAELLSFPMVSEVAELKCVQGSPDVTYNWTGIPLFHLLTVAQIRPEAYKLAIRASDGFSSDLLIEDALKPTTILALGANGTDLPEINGIKGLYRLVVPGKWGYKWVGYVTEIEVVNYDYKGTYEGLGGFPDEADRPNYTVVPSITPPMQEMDFVFGNRTFKVEAFTNVSINAYTLDVLQKELILNVSVPSGTKGFADFKLQQDFLKGPFSATVDTQATDIVEADLTNQSYLYISLEEGSHTVRIVGTEIFGIHSENVLPPMSLTVVGLNGTQVVLNSTDIAGLPSVRGLGGFKQIVGNTSSPDNYTGVPLMTLCNTVGEISNNSIVRITASDNYSMSFSFDQAVNGNFTTFDPATGNIVPNSKSLTPIIAYYKNDANLTSDEGPIVLAIIGPEGLLTPASYWVRLVVKIEILSETIPEFQSFPLMLLLLTTMLIAVFLFKKLRLKPPTRWTTWSKETRIVGFHWVTFSFLPTNDVLRP